MTDKFKDAIEAMQTALDALGTPEPPIEPTPPPPPIEPSPQIPVEFSFNEENGLFAVSVNSVEVITAHYSFFINSSFINNDWGQWRSLNTTVTELEDGHRIVGTRPELGLTLDMETAQTDSQFIYDMNVMTDTLINDTIGGGLEFKFKNGEVSSTEDTITLTGDYGTIQIKFDSPPARMHKQGAHNVRAFILSERIFVGETTNRMTVTLPEGAVFLEPEIDRLGGKPDDTWHTDILDSHLSPVDFRYLNDTYAGERGYMQVQGEKLVFEDGTEFKAWGTNLSAYSIFSTINDNIKIHAKRIADLGYNVVRIHHHDSHWVRPNIFSASGLSEGELSASAFEKLDLWKNELKSHGVYIFLDLHVGRWYQSTDGIDNYAETVKRDRRAFGFNYINEDIERLMVDFATQYLTHDNNGTRYIDDPAIVGICITNENDITHHFGHGLDDQPNSTAKFMAKMEAFGFDNGLSGPFAPWLPGASQKALNDIEHQFNERQIAHLNSLGCNVPIVTTQAWSGTTKSLPALMDGDIIDNHSYAKGNFLKSNPVYKDNIVHWVGYTQINGKPFTCTEWNQEGFPDDYDRVVLPLYMAAVGCLQDWDALYHFDYASDPLQYRAWHGPSEYQAHNDPSMIALMPAASLLFRKKHVKKANKTYVYSVDHEEFFSNFARPSNSAAFRTIIEQSRFVVDIPKTPELPWLDPAPLPDDVIKITDTNKSYLEGNVAVSDTGELIRDFVKGQYFINTSQTQAVMGWIGGHRLPVGGLTVEMATPFAAVCVQAVDGLPIEKSNKLFITVAGRSYPTWVARDDGSGYWGYPMKSEPIHGTIRIQHEGGLNGTYVNGEYVMEFSGPDTYWFWLERG